MGSKNSVLDVLVGEVIYAVHRAPDYDGVAFETLKDILQHSTKAHVFYFDNWGSEIDQIVGYHAIMGRRVVATSAEDDKYSLTNSEGESFLITAAHFADYPEKLVYKGHIEIEKDWVCLACDDGC